MEKVGSPSMAMTVKWKFRRVRGCPGDSVVKNLLPVQETQDRSLGWEALTCSEQPSPSMGHDY